MLVAALHREVRAHRRVEVCGFLGGSGDVARSIHPVTNIAHRPARRFEMDPAEQIHAMKAMRARGERMLAIYHSHPDMPPEPSARDIRGLGYPEALMLILGLDGVTTPTMRAWRCDMVNVSEVPITIID